MDKGKTAIGKGLRKAGLALLGLGLLGLAGCAIKDGNTDPGDGNGVVVSVTDSTKVTLDFDDINKKIFTESNSFNLDTLRKKLNDKNIDLESIKIIGLVVTYDAATKQFLTDNEGVQYALRIYTNTMADTGKGKLTLETYNQASGKAPTLNPDQVLFELNKHLFGKEDGMPFLLASIQDTSVKELKVTAELEILGSLKKTGKLNLNLVIDVAGKV
jgi:hypothetical protein